MGRKQPVDRTIKRQVPRRRKTVKGQGRLVAQDDGEKVRKRQKERPAGAQVWVQKRPRSIAALSFLMR